MTPIRRVAFIGNSLPRRCGIATFTTHLQEAVAASYPALETCIVAMTDHGQVYDYPATVALQIKADDVDAYARARNFLNAGRFDTICLQHEFGIFGGEAGAHILVLLSGLTMPVVTTLHTVLGDPTAAQRAVLTGIIEASSKIVVMGQRRASCFAAFITCRTTKSKSSLTAFQMLPLSRRMRPRPGSGLPESR